MKRLVGTTLLLILAISMIGAHASGNIPFWFSLSGGGQSSSSSHYNLIGVIGQDQPVGATTRASYILGAGFFYGLGLPSQPSPPDLTDGLVAYWPLDGDYQDASGNGHHGTPAGSGGLFFSSGKVGQGLDFAAGGNEVRAGTFDPSSGDMTIALWVYWRGEENPAFHDMFLGKRDNWDANQMRWQLARNYFDMAGMDGTLRFEQPAGKAIYSVDLVPYAWNHLTIVYDGDWGEATLYLNGVNQGTGPMVFGNDADALVRFGWTHSILDEIRIYDRALSGEEIVALPGF